ERWTIAYSWTRLVSERQRAGSRVLQPEGSLGHLHSIITRMLRPGFDRALTSRIRVAARGWPAGRRAGALRRGAGSGCAPPGRGGDPWAAPGGSLQDRGGGAAEPLPPPCWSGEAYYPCTGLRGGGLDFFRALDASPPIEQFYANAVRGTAELLPTLASSGMH